MGVWRLIAEDMHEWKRIGFSRPNARHTRLRLGEALSLYWRFPGVRATVVYRLSYAAHRRHIPLLPGILYRRNLRHYGLDIPSGVPIGPGLYIPHPVGIVVMAIEIGRHCHLISAITIGMRNEHAFPRIGNDVTIGAGARVLGGIHIGDRAQIGANAVVIDDVPAGTTAVGIPARLVRTSEPVFEVLGG
jgi:serine O-acetyltransferase